MSDISGTQKNVLAISTDTSPTGSFDAFTAPPRALGGFIQTMPASGSTAVAAGVVGQAYHNSAQNITGNGHNLGVIGITDVKTAVTVAAMYASEGRVQASAGTQTVAACFIAAAQNVTEGAAGAIGVLVDYYSPTFSDHAHITVKFGYYCSDPNKISRNEGVWNQRGTLTQGAGDRAVNGAVTWVRFDGTGTPAITDDLNVASITDHGAGDYTINFSADLANANYCVSGCGNGNVVITQETGTAPTTSAVRVRTMAMTTVTPTDVTRTYVAIHGGI